MIYFTYGRKLVDGEWNHPNGFLPAYSQFGIFYEANWFGCAEIDSLNIIWQFDPTEISQSYFNEAVASGSMEEQTIL